MRTITLSVILAGSALAQSPPPPAFEVASVKINRDFRQEDRSTWQSKNDFAPGSLTMRNASLTTLLAWAYHVQRPQISGPAGIDELRYDVLAKAGTAADVEAMRVMLQALLSERFKLAIRRETRQVDALVIVVPKGGHKMKPSSVTGEVQHEQDPALGQVLKGVPLMELASELAREANLPILDQTGLTGRFDFAFNPQKYVQSLRSQWMANLSQAPPESEARIILLQEMFAGDLGLKIEPRRAAVEMLIVERFEKVPADN